MRLKLLILVTALFLYLKHFPPLRFSFYVLPYSGYISRGQYFEVCCCLCTGNDFRGLNFEVAWREYIHNVPLD